MNGEILTITAGELIENALRDARIIAAEQPVQPKDLSAGIRAINLIIKHWQAQGIHLWSETQAIVPLVTGQRKYLLGPNGDEVAVASTFFDTTLTVAGVATDDRLTVAATSGTTKDGQSISISAAPDILATDPAASLQDWTAINTTLELDAIGLVVTQVGNSTASGADYPISTTAGVTYQLEFTYAEVSNISMDVFVLDSAGTIVTQTFTDAGSFTLEFTARDADTTLRFLNSGTLANDQKFRVSAINFRNKAAGDRIGIELDDGTRFWSSVVSVDSATQVTINQGLPSAAAIGRTVYTYSRGIARPMRILNAQHGENLAATEIRVRQWSREEYFDQPDKDSSGTVVNWYYTPVLGTGELYVWQVASSVNQILRFTYVDVIEIPTSTSDSLDFPSEWNLPLKWAIAAELGPSRGVSESKQVILETKAASTLNQVLGFDVERDNLSLQPDFT